MAIKKVVARGATRYRVEYRQPGSRNVQKRTFDTMDEAKSFEGDVIKAKRGVIELPAARVSHMTLEQFGDDYRDKYMAVELAPATRAIYAGMWNRYILPRLGHLPLSALDAATVQSFKADLIADGVGTATVAKSLNVLGAVLSKAVAWGKLQGNPVAAVKKPTQKRARKVTPMPADVVTELLGSLKGRDRSMVAILAYAGLRPGELLALTSADVTSDVIHVSKAISLGDEKGTKTGVDRVVPVLAPLGDYLTDLPAGLLFARRDGQPWRDTDYRNWRSRAFKPAVAALGDQWATFRPYDLRHTTASRLLMEGWAPIEVAEVMGHSVQVLLSTYGHVIAEMRWSKRAA